MIASASCGVWVFSGRLVEGPIPRANTSNEGVWIVVSLTAEGALYMCLVYCMFIIACVSRFEVMWTIVAEWQLIVSHSLDFKSDLSQLRKDA